MIRRLAFLLPFLVAGSALAQQPDPAQALIDEWTTVQASDTMAAAAHKHTAETAAALVQSYRAMKAELDKAKADNAALESRLGWTLDNWVPKTPAEAKP